MPARGWTGSCSSRPSEWEEPAILVAEEEGCGKVHAGVTGGETRSDSVRAGLAEVPADVLVVLDGTMRHLWRFVGDEIAHFELFHDAPRMRAFYAMTAQ